MKWTIKCENIKGKINKKYNRKCHDKIYYLNKEKILCAALADGAGCAKYGDIGAYSSVKASCEYMEKNFDNLFELEEEKIKYKLFCHIKRKLRELILEKDILLKDLASTLLVIAIKEDKYIMISLGDGYIGQLDDEKVKTMFYVDSRKNNKKKFLTSSLICYKYAEAKKGYVNNSKSFFMCSDGFFYCFDKYNHSEVMNVYNKISSNKKLNKVINNRKIIDDLSYILILKK